MTVAQTRAARRKGNLYRRENGPALADPTKTMRRLKDRLEAEKLRQARKKGT